jgi:hypothetical protein
VHPGSQKLSGYFEIPDGFHPVNKLDACELRRDNSTMVRLKPNITIKIRGIKTSFQFHSGSIKTTKGDLVVQELAFDGISIPLWFD